MANVSPRKVVRAKRVVTPNARPESPFLKSVTFNDDIVETSIGGTQRVGKIKKDVLLHFDTPVRINGSRSGGTAVTPASNGRSSGPGKENMDDGVDKSTDASKEISTKSALATNLNNNNATTPRTSNQMTRSANSQQEVAEVKPASKMETSLNEQEVISRRDASAKVTVRTSNGPKAPQSNLGVGRQDESSSNEGSFIKPDTPSYLDSRRTTMEQIQSVALSPFHTPHGKNARRHTLESKLFATPDCYRDVNFGTPRLWNTVAHDESTDVIEDGEDSCSIMVAVRVRPFCQRELDDPNVRCAVSMAGNETTMTSDNGNVHRFVYDFSFWSHDRGSSSEFCDQEMVYTRLAQPLLGKAFEGYNTCLFAYGQTGSGKSYSIMGRANDTGIIPRFCAELFSRAEMLTTKKKVKVNVEISFFEIYKEKIHDLLASTKDKGAKKVTLKVREHPVLGPYVEGLSTYVVNSFEDVEGWITLGNKNRATAATGMNDKSSRSHSVFTIVLSQTKIDTTEGQAHDHCVNSKINLVDLAGSERQSLANTSGERLREGASINKSLLTLGKVISLLCDRSQSSKKSKIFIPYRESVLTWLLKESLGGNSKTAMIATISPSNQHIEETLSTLRYAQQARSIVNVVRINEDPKAKLIRQLRTEIERLRTEQGGAMNEEALAASMAEIARLKYEMEELSRSLQERLRQAEAKKAEELKLMERAGITFKVDNTLPNLVNLNEDPQLSEMLLYVIKEGETRVGRSIDDSRHDIKLTGALIADNHCIITNSKGVVEITPIGDAPTYVNGDLVSQAVVLQHGDRVILGGDHYFRFNHPMQVKSNKSPDARSSDIKDFEFAKQELHRVQEARLQALLEVELEKTRKEISQQKDGYENKLKGLESALSEVEQTHKEAQSTINNLKKQNQILEQEVIAGRNRGKLELTLAQKSLEQARTKGQLEEMMEAKVKQTADRLKHMKQIMAKILGLMPANLAVMQTSALGSPGSRKDLYKVALLLREANKINQHLKTNLVFARDDVQSEDGSGSVHTQIRVTNTRHRMFTLWPVAKFEGKLAQMRDLYENEDGTSADDEVFHDPEDVWEKESSLASPGHQDNRSKNVGKFTAVLPRTPLTGLRRAGSLSTYSPKSSQELDSSMVKACKSLLSSMGDQHTVSGLKESLIDQVLATCQRIKGHVHTVAGTKSAVGTSWARPMLQIVADIHLLTYLTNLGSSFYEDIQSPLLQDMLDMCSDQVKVVGLQATSLLQGCESQLTSLISESGHKLTTALQSLCETSGQLALATESSVYVMEQPDLEYDQNILSPELARSFLSGSNKFTIKILEGCLGSLENCDSRRLELAQTTDKNAACHEMSERLKHVLSCIQALVLKTLHLQEVLGQDGSDLQPLPYYSAAFRRLQGIVNNVSSIVDVSELLLKSAEPLAKGVRQDGKQLENCVEMIRHSCQQLSSVSSLSYTLPASFSSSSQVKHSESSSTLSTSSSVSSQSDTSQSTATSTSSLTLTSSGESTSVTPDLTDVTLLSESQLCELDAAVHEVSMAMSLFTEYTRKTWSAAPESIGTPKVSRAGEQNQTKLMVTPAHYTAHLKKLDTKRTLDLAMTGNDKAES